MVTTGTVIKVDNPVFMENPLSFGPSVNSPVSFINIDNGQFRKPLGKFLVVFLIIDSPH